MSSAATNIYKSKASRKDALVAAVLLRHGDEPGWIASALERRDPARFSHCCHELEIDGARLDRPDGGTPRKRILGSARRQDVLLGAALGAVFVLLGLLAVLAGTRLWDTRPPIVIVQESEYEQVKNRYLRSRAELDPPEQFAARVLTVGPKRVRYEVAQDRDSETG